MNQIYARARWFLVFFFLAAAALASPLPPGLEKELAKAGIPLESVGLYIKVLGGRAPLLSVNAAMPFSPASTMKLVTAYSALALLGPAYTWKTEMWTDGGLNEDRLLGSLVVRGRGDPSLTLERLWAMARQAREKIRVVEGDMVLDTSAFAAADGAPGDFDNKGDHPYNALPSALTANFNTHTLKVSPKGNMLSLSLDPPLFAMDLQNQVRLVSGKCLPQKISGQVEAAARPTLVLQGVYASGCETREFARVFLSSEHYFANAFLWLWYQLGGEVHGVAKVGQVAGGAKKILEYPSPPLAQVLHDMMKYSNNLMARQIFLTLALETKGAPATLEKARRTVKDILDARGLSFPELFVENGSGLSRMEQISPQHLGMLLEGAYESPFMPEFIASLPVAGVDGTLHKHFRGSDLRGKAHLKTGSLENAKALAGYVDGEGGKRVVFVAMINDPRAGQAWPFLEAAVRYAALGKEEALPQVQAPLPLKASSRLKAG